MLNKLMTILAAIALSACMAEAPDFANMTPNDISRYQSQQSGDDISKPLTVYHSIVPLPEPHRTVGPRPYQQVADYLRGQGLMILQAGSSGIEATEVALVTDDAFDSKTARWDLELAPLGWSYGGWLTEHTRTEEQY